jgi:hypothetical protein
MAALTVWTNPLAAQLPGAIPAQIEEKLRHALKEFFLQSRAWRTTLGPFDVTSGVALVTPTPPANSQIVWIRDVWLQEGGVFTPLQAATAEITEARTGKPTHFYSESPDTLMLWPTPDTTLTQVLYAHVALTMTDATSVVPDLSASHHYEAIEHGALARLFAIPNKPWSDPAMAFRYARMFRRRCLELRAISDAGYLRTDPSWRFPSFA